METTQLSRFGRVSPRQDNKEDLAMNKGREHLKATAGTKIGGTKQRGAGLKLHSDYKPFAGGSKRAVKQSKKAV